MAKKYRTKSGKVEEKLPGINATVSPSEKVQIAMAGGANTLSDVQTILGQQGKRNNLKGQGAKNIVSFQYEGMGGQDDPDEPGQSEPGTFGGVEVGDSFWGIATDPAPTPAPLSSGDDGTGEAARESALNALLNTGGRGKDPEGKAAPSFWGKELTAATLRKAQTAQNRTEVLFGMRNNPPVLTPGLSPLESEKRQEEIGMKSLTWAKKTIDAKWGIPGINYSIGRNPKTGVYGVDTDPSNLYTGLALGVLAAAAPIVAPALAPVASTVSQGHSLYTGYKSLTAKAGYKSLVSRYQNYQKTTMDYPVPEKASPIPSPPDEGGDDTPKKKKKKPISYTNNVGIAVVDPGQLTRKQRREAKFRTTRYA